MGLSDPALSSIHKALDLDPNNAKAILLHDKVQLLESNLRSFDAAKIKKDWTSALLALDKCLSAIDAEGADIHVDWTRRIIVSLSIIYLITFD